MDKLIKLLVVTYTLFQVTGCATPARLTLNADIAPPTTGKAVVVFYVRSSLLSGSEKLKIDIMDEGRKVTQLTQENDFYVRLEVEPGSHGFHTDFPRMAYANIKHVRHLAPDSVNYRMVWMNITPAPFVPGRLIIEPTVGFRPIKDWKTGGDKLDTGYDED